MKVAVSAHLGMEMATSGVKLRDTCFQITSPDSVARRLDGHPGTTLDVQHCFKKRSW